MLTFVLVVKYLNAINEFMRNTIDFIPFYWRELDSNYNNGKMLSHKIFLEYTDHMICISLYTTLDTLHNLDSNLHNLDTTGAGAVERVKCSLSYWYIHHVL